MSVAAAKRGSRRGRAHRYHVYVVELSDRVWNVAAFRRANPDYELGKPFVYVGMTGLDPDLRFDRHMHGIQANRFVREYGVREQTLETLLARRAAAAQACQTP